MFESRVAEKKFVTAIIFEDEIFIEICRGLSRRILKNLVFHIEAAGFSVDGRK